MRTGEIQKLLESTRQAAFAVTQDGSISAWNKSAEKLFAVPAAFVLGQPCWEVVKGSDECGAVCGEDCVALQRASGSTDPIAAFDLQTETADGPQWFNVAVLRAQENGDNSLHSIHILTPIDVAKRMEQLMKDFVAGNLDLTSEEATALVRSHRALTRNVELTDREFQILQMMGRGNSNKEIANQLNLSPATANNHVHHILHKLNAHNRVEAVRRAEHAGLL